MQNINVEITNVVENLNNQISSFPAGTKIVREKLINDVAIKSFMKSEDIKSLLTIVINMRDDVSVRKGKTGGTFKI